MMLRHCMHALFTIAIMTAHAGVAAEERQVYINNGFLSLEQIAWLETAYRVPVMAGRYWYDPVSGVWGMEGGPMFGQIHPGLALGGPLRADASGGGTGVFVNGRELHPLDVERLRQFMLVLPGRYWVNAQGVGSIEGGPALFNLGALAGGEWYRAGPGGYMGGSGGCVYHQMPGSGEGVMSSRC